MAAKIYAIGIAGAKSSSKRISLAFRISTTNRSFPSFLGTTKHADWPSTSGDARLITHALYIRSNQTFMACFACKELGYGRVKAFRSSASFLYFNSYSKPVNDPISSALLANAFILRLIMSLKCALSS